MLIVSAVVNVLGLTLPLFTMSVFDRVFTSRNEDTLFLLIVAAVLGLAATGALETLRAVAFGRIANWITYSLAPEALARSVERRLVDNRLRTEILREIGTIRAFLGGPSAAALLDLPWLPLYVVIAYLIHPIFCGVAILGGLILFGLAFASDRIQRRDIETSAALSAAGLRDGDALIRNAEIVDGLGMTSPMIERWSVGMINDLSAQERIQERTAMALGFTRFTRAGLQVALYGVAGLLVINDNLSSGSVIAASIIVSRLLSPVEAIIGQWRSMRMARESFRRLEEFFRLPRRASTDTELPRPQGKLAIDNLSMRLPGHPLPILRGVNVSLNAGEQLAIVGPAGSGKTTLARLLIGIARPDLGSVRLDGVDVSQWSRDDFGAYIGYLPQDVELFAGTVAQNIARFQDAEDVQVVSAAKFAGCHQMILGLPRGYETQVGEDGTLLSGGQRQQIGLARALFRQPRFIVLDEPNSNLDVRGDNALSRALQRLSTLRVTTIIITHRPYILSSVDKILVLDQGAVRKFGSPAEVLGTNLVATPVAKPKPDAANEPARREATANTAAANRPMVAEVIVEAAE